jgi:hypothetical protein
MTAHQHPPAGAVRTRLDAMVKPIAGHEAVEMY